MRSNTLKTILLLTVLFLPWNSNVFGQDRYLTNSSFEDIPRLSGTPTSWIDCGFMNSSPPDIQPTKEMQTQVNPPQHGYTYLTMVTRNDDTYERIGQKLQQPIRKDSLYNFSIYLASHEQYHFPDPLALKKRDQSSNTKPDKGASGNFTSPILLKVWAGNTECHLQELLLKTPAIDHKEWESYDYLLIPQETYQFLTLEAYYDDQHVATYNGNIMLDDCKLARVTSRQISNSISSEIVLENILSKKASVSMMSTPLCSNILTIWNFHEILEQNKLHSFIQSTSQLDLTSLVNNLHKFLLIENAFALEELIIELEEPTKETQETVIENFIQNKSREDLYSGLIDFIENNKILIIEELLAVGLIQDLIGTSH